MFVDFLKNFSTTMPASSRRHVAFFGDDTRDSTSSTSGCFFDDVVHYSRQLISWQQGTTMVSFVEMGRAHAEIFTT